MASGVSPASTADPEEHLALEIPPEVLGAVGLLAILAALGCLLAR